MPTTLSRRAAARRALNTAILLAAVAVLATAAIAAAQQLPLKPGPGQPESEPCAPQPEPASPAGPAVQEAARLATEATRAALVGDDARALDRLRQAAQLDPTAAPIAYRLARLLDDSGDAPAALREYCRYLGLAGSSPEAEEVSARVAALAPQPAPAIDPGAAQTFRQGVRELEAGAAREAVASFNATVAAEPSWADAYYNRALALAALGATEEAATDLHAYLRLAPQAADRALVQAELRRLRPSSPPGAASALAVGLALPGGAQFVTGRPLIGVGVLAGVGAAVTAGLLTRRIEVRCLAPPQNGHCPPEDVLDQRVDRPYLVPAVLGAAVLSALAALEGYRVARGERTRDDGASQRRSEAGSQQWLQPTGNQQWLQPSIGAAPSGLRLEWALRF